MVSSRSNTTPLMAKDPLDRQAGVYAKALRMVENPEFAKLNRHTQAKILDEYYKEWVLPAYTVSNIAPPDKTIWVRGMRDPSNRMSVADFYLNRGSLHDASTDAESAFFQMGAVAAKALSNIMNGAIVAGIKADSKVFGLKPYLTAPEPTSLEARDDWRARLAHEERNPIVASFMKMNQASIDGANFWMEMRPSKTFSEKAGSFVGENAATLPLYEAIGAMRLGITAGTANKILSQAAVPTAAASRTIQSANFTRRLLASPAGRFIGRRLGEAADAYIGSTVQQDAPGQKAASVLSFMGIGTIAEGLGATGVKLISRAAMKKQLAHDAVIGGVPYIDAMANQADHELKHIVIGIDHNGHEIRMQHDGNGKYKISTPTQEWNVDGHEQAMDAFVSLDHSAHEADPIRHKAVTAAKMSLTSIAKEMHGDGTLWRNLSQKQRTAVRVEYAKRTAEAIEEIPLHVPEVAAHEAKQSIQESVAASPKLKQTFAELDALGKELGITVESAVIEGEQSAIKDETGLRSVQAVAYKAANVTREIVAEVKAPKSRADQLFQDLRHSGNLRYNSGDQAYNVKFASKVDKALYNLNAKMGNDMAKNANRMANQTADMKLLKLYFPDKTPAQILEMSRDVKAQLDAEIKERRPNYNKDPETEGNVLFPAKYETVHTVAKEPETQNFDSFRTSALSPITTKFTNGAKEAGHTLDSYLRGMADNDFVNEIRSQIGHSIHFERPDDMMLWTLHHESSLPEPVYKKVLNYLKDQDPTQTVEMLRKQAKTLDHHIQLMSYSGRLDGNTFTSKVTSAWTDETRWKKEILAEVSKEEVNDFSRSMNALKKNFPEQYNEGLGMLLRLQSMRNKVKTIESAVEHTENIRHVIKNPTRSAGE